MRLALIGAVVAALAVAVAASASTPINGTDRANAARACTALRTANSSAFATQFASFGACTSQWVHKANAARTAAQAACRSKGVTGTKLAACVKTATRPTIATEVTAAKNAAKACAAERASLGDAAFEKKYGANGNLRNAFGKCVSQKASAGNQSGGGGGGSNQAAQHFTVTFGQLNSSSVSGTGSLTLKGGRLQVRLALTGLEAGQTHHVAIRGLASGSASCPTAAADTNHDGTITLSEGQPFFGAVLLELDPSVLSSMGLSMTVQSSVSPLQTRTIVVLGKTVNGSYDATLPVACGTIALK
jgi:hypothetical protein